MSSLHKISYISTMIAFLTQKLITNPKTGLDCIEILTKLEQSVVWAL